MNSKTVGILVTVGVVATFIISIGIWAVGISNTEIELRTQAEAQQKNNENIYQKVWTVIKQKAQVTDKYASDFKDIYVNLMDERYKGDEKNNPAFKWIHEQNPQLSVEMYKDLGDSIGGLRAEFAMVQARLIDIKREHDVLRKRFPSKLVVGGREALEIVIVTSQKTKDTFAVGEENNVDVF
jgi:hypothetical protein